MKKTILILIFMIGYSFVFSQNLTGDLNSYIPKFYQLIKDSADFRYHKTFSVSLQGAQFSSINKVLEYSKKNKLDTLNILIYGNLEAETVYIDTPFRFISICGVNSACNAGLSNTVFINKADSIYLTLQNLSFSVLRNEAYMAYMGFFHNMIEKMISTTDVAFSDIFASEITMDFNWPSTGYLAFTQGSGVGKNFYGIISNCYNTRGDTLFLFGDDQKRELYFADNFAFSRYLHVTGYLNVQNQISIMNGRSVSIIRADETTLAGDFKSRTKADSIYFSSNSMKSGVTTDWLVKGDLNVGEDGLARLSKDGNLFLKEKNGDSIIFRGGQLLMSKNDISGEGTVYMNSFSNYPGMPLLLKYNAGVNSSVKWAIADGDRIEEFSMMEDSSGCIFVRKKMAPDTLSGDGEINPLSGAAELKADRIECLVSNSFAPILFSDFKVYRDKRIFSWNKKNSKICVHSTGLFYAGYRVILNRKSLSQEDQRVAFRVMKNGIEESSLNSIASMRFPGFFTLGGSGVLRLTEGDSLSLEFFSSDLEIAVESDNIFSSGDGISFYIYQVK
ncbi:MAG: hypothetical protein PHW02_08340 [bacterium]|nr:hypothetical protein [bacterium]